MKMFPELNPKQSFPKLEEEIINFWKENNIFEKSIENRSKNNPYRFYDWPPFITGTPHYWHLLVSAIKDAVPRYWTMKWKRCERIWGWDCHWIAVEEKVMKKLGINSNSEIEKNWIENFIEECYNYTKQVSSEWNWYIDHIGRWVDMDNAYKTMNQNYMESVMWTFKQFYDKWFIYKWKRISQYSVKLWTPISNFEVAMDDSYESVNDPAITVKFDLWINWKEWEWVYVLAWTTTPWTLPANLALAVNEDCDYVIIELKDETWKLKGEKYILAKNRVEEVMKWKWEYEIIQEFKWDKLVWLSYQPLFNFYVWKVDEKNFKIYNANFITDTDWTGIGHQAPEFGEVDFQLWKDNWLYQTESIDDECNYSYQIPDYQCRFIKDCQQDIIQRLKEEWKLFKKENITHRIAVCPRTQVPLVYRTQDTWFFDIQWMKDKLLEQNQNINWFPEYLKNWRFAKNIEFAPDWCLSRKRYWATPMPMWTDENEDEKLVIWSLEEIYEKNKDFGQVTKIIFVRHWRTDYNEKWLMDYKNKASLNDIGKEQAKQVFEKFKNINIDACYSSPLDRCVNTIQDLAEINWLKINKIDELIEVNSPNLQDQVFSCKNYKWENWYWWWEKIKEVYERVSNFMKKILENNKWKTILVCAHGDIVFLSRMFLRNNIDYDTEKYNSGLYLENNPKYWINKMFAVDYVFDQTNKILDLHKHNLDKIYLKSHKTWNTLTRVSEVLDVWLESGSMSLSQFHYPFENKEYFEKAYPADFIVEYVWQIRAWFYVMHVVGVALFDQNAYQNVITTGIIAGNDGRKMSKSFGNFTDPKELLLKYGWDAIRFYVMNSPLVKWWDINFMDEWVLDVVKKLLLPIWNTLYFFTTYANIDNYEGQFDEILNEISNSNFHKLNYNKLDKWIISELNQLIKEVDESMLNYDLQKSTNSISNFVQNLTNWYIRRSRRRFWKSENDDDKMQAYDTLYYVLIQFSKVLAPFCPFIAEKIYKILNDKESVHLENFPLFDEKLIDYDLNEEMNLVQNIISLWLWLRSKNSLRVRQALASISIWENLSDYYIDIIKDELNVKKVITNYDISQIAKKIAMPNAKLIWPKYWKAVQEIIKNAKEANFEELQDWKIKVGDYVLEKNEFEISYQTKWSDLSVHWGFGTVIAMDLNITKELKNEWYARDIVRIIQEARKEIDYNVADRIKIQLKIDNWEKIIDNFGEYIQNETLSEIVEELLDFDIEKEFDLDWVKWVVRLKK